MERDCESELSKLNIEQNACIYHFGASVIHGQRSNILRLRLNSNYRNLMADNSIIVMINRIYPGTDYSTRFVPRIVFLDTAYPQ